MENTPEKIARLYLRLNGFFVLPHFTILPGSENKREYKHIDLIAIKPAGAKEKIGQNNGVLAQDTDFLKKLGNGEVNIAVIAEVKGGRKGNCINRFEDERVEYCKNIFGEVFKDNIKFVCFRKSAKEEIVKRKEVIHVPLKYCVDWIVKRIESVKKDKIGSWELSDEFLSDILYLCKLEVFETNAQKVVKRQ